jgi:hypothetical protein
LGEFWDWGFCCNSGYGSVDHLGYDCEIVTDHGKKIAIGFWDGRGDPDRVLETGFA